MWEARGLWLGVVNIVLGRAALALGLALVGRGSPICLRDWKAVSVKGHGYMVNLEASIFTVYLDKLCELG